METSDEAGRVFCEHLAFAWHVALSATRDASEAEDVVQDAYLNFVKGFAGFDRSRPVRPYLARAVTNAAADRARAEARRAEHHAALARERGTDMPDLEMNREQAEALHAALRRLEPGLRLAVALRHLHGLSLEETAEALALPRATASDRVARGLEELRKILAAAGFGALAPAAIAALPMPAVPAGLQAALYKLAGQHLGSATGAGSLAGAAKGGLIVKIGLGIAAVGLAAGATFWAVGGKTEEPAKPPAAALAERKDAPFDQVYRMEPVVGARNPGKTAAAYGLPARGYAAGPLDGPGIEADFVSNIADLAVDDAGNCYWTESSSSRINVVRMWRVSDDRAITLAGSASGHLDGPIGSARFSGWGAGGYGNSLVEVTRDGKHLFLKEPFNNCVRHIDLEAGTVSTLTGSAGARQLCFSRDASGEVYVFDPQGGKVPEGKGYKTLQTAKFEGFPWSGQAYRALDVAKGRFYNHDRYEIRYWDIKTGKKTDVTPVCKYIKGTTDPVTLDGKPTLDHNVSGPLSLCRFYCPVGLAISPSGRYLYIGSGDGSTMHRLDLEKNERLNLAHNWADGTCFFKEGEVRTTTTAWPGQLGFAADGTIYWGSSSGIVRLVPVKKGANP